MPPVHLPPVMSLYSPNRLSQIILSAMLVVWMTELVLVKDNAGIAAWCIRAVQIPIMSCILALNGHVIFTRHNHVEASSVYCFQLFRIKHPLTSSS